MRGACSVQYYYPSSRRRRQSICSAVILKTPLFSLVDLFTALLAARQAAGALQSRSPARGHYFTDSVTAHVRPTSGSYFCFSQLHFVQIVFCIFLPALESRFWSVRDSDVAGVRVHRVSWYTLCMGCMCALCEAAATDVEAVWT